MAAPALQPRSPLVDLLLILGGFVGTVAVAVGVTTQPRLGDTAVLLLVGGIAFLGLVALALTRFEDYLVVLFVVRTALDHLKSGGPGGGLLQPPSLIGALTIGAGLLWLWSRQRNGLLVPTSRFSVALVVLSGLTFVNPLFAVGRSESLQSAIRIFSFTVLYVVLEQLFRSDPGARRRLLRAICWSLVLPALIGFQQFVGSTGTDDYLEVSRVRGTFVHPNPFATYLVMVVLLALVLAWSGERRLRPVFHLVAAVATGFLVLTYARAAWAALVVGLVVLGLRLDRRLLRLLAVGAVLLVVLVPSIATRLADLDDQQEANAGDPNSLAWRVGYWEELLPLGLDAPIGGIGLDSTELVRPEQLQPHNVFVQAFVELGVPGLLAVIGLLVAAASELHRAGHWARDREERALAALATAVGAGFALQLFSENLLTQPVSLWYLGVVVAAAVANGWEAGVSPLALRGERSVRQRIRRLLDTRRPPAEVVRRLAGVDLGARVAEILERGSATRDPERAPVPAVADRDPRSRVAALLERQRPPASDLDRLAEVDLPARVADILRRNGVDRKGQPTGEAGPSGSKDASP